MGETSEKEKTVLELAKDHNAVVIHLSLNACGYYSESEYSEEIAILVEDYEKYIDGKVEIDPFGGTTITISDLDGKFSETDGEIDVNFFTEDDLKSRNLSLDSLDKDGRYLSDYLFGSNSELEDQLKTNFEKYYSNIDYIKTIKVSVKKSQVQKVLDFVKELNNESGK